MKKIRNIAKFTLGSIIIGYIDFCLAYVALSIQNYMIRSTLIAVFIFISGINCLYIYKMKIFKDENANRWMPFIGYLIAFLLLYVLEYNNFINFI